MPTTLTRLKHIPALQISEVEEIESVERLYRFRAPTAYLSLIAWDDPDDPIRKLVIPRPEEHIEVESLDPTGEAMITVARGIQHKFPDTALLLVTANCSAYCRYCFRKRIFQPTNEEVPNNLAEAYQYIRMHPEINNVILSGGDALAMSTRRLRLILDEVSQIPTIRIIRIGSKTPAFEPDKIIGNQELKLAIKASQESGKQIYLLAHFDHPREVTKKAAQAIKELTSAGVACLNQCPLLKGVNCAPGVLGELFEVMSFIGCPQYYVFHCRPTDGNSHFMLPLSKAYEIFERELNRGSGLAKTARYCISHQTGKIQVLDIRSGKILLRYLQATDPQMTGRTFWQDVDEAESLPNALAPLP